MPRPESLLAILSPIEARYFLPEPSWHELNILAGRFRHVDPLAVPASAVRQAIADFQPKIIVACWKTPALPLPLPDSVRYVCYLCGSVKKLIARDHLASGLLVTNWGGSISRIVAEWALFHTLSCLRRATEWAIGMHLEGAWKNDRTETASLFDRKVGIHGFGQVARELLRLLAPFGAQVSIFAPDVDAAAEKRHGIRRAPTLEALFAENDIVIELAPLIPETVGIITEDLLRLIRPGGVFVNVGRGAVVDEAALLRVAREGRIQVGLDVFGQEPLRRFPFPRPAQRHPHPAPGRPHRRPPPRCRRLRPAQPSRLRRRSAPPGHRHHRGLRPLFLTLRDLISQISNLRSQILDLRSQIPAPSPIASRP